MSRFGPVFSAALSAQFIDICSLGICGAGVAAGLKHTEMYENRRRTFKTLSKAKDDGNASLVKKLEAEMKRQTEEIEEKQKNLFIGKSISHTLSAFFGGGSK